MKLGLYQHYKGSVYEVLGVATHTETGQHGVVYQPILKPETVWFRPLEGPGGWNELIEIRGVWIPRFRHLDDL